MKFIFWYLVTINFIFFCPIRLLAQNEESKSPYVEPTFEQAVLSSSIWNFDKDDVGAVFQHWSFFWLSQKFNECASRDSSLSIFGIKVKEAVVRLGSGKVSEIELCLFDKNLKSTSKPEEIYAAAKQAIDALNKKNAAGAESNKPVEVDGKFVQGMKRSA